MAVKRMPNAWQPNLEMTSGHPDRAAQAKPKLSEMYALHRPFVLVATHDVEIILPNKGVIIIAISDL